LKKILLMILDGFGIATDTNTAFNAIAAAATPCLDSIQQNYPTGQLYASEQHLGLPAGQFGNSEVGHLTIGAGRVVKQSSTIIDEAIATGTFATNPALQLVSARCTNGVLHLMGLCSDGGVHAQQRHLLELIRISHEMLHIKRIYLHIWLDGRDTAPQSAVQFVGQLMKFLQQYPKASIATICGRYYAMDRDTRFERTALAYQVITQAQTQQHFTDPIAAIKAAYNDNINDEFILPMSAIGYAGMQDADSMICSNYRADRVIQLISALILPDFTAFSRPFTISNCLTMTHYTDNLPCLVSYPRQPIINSLGECLSQHDLRQLRIAETEKYPHISYFFNGGQHAAFIGEDRTLVPSPKVATYNLCPAMSLPTVAAKLQLAIKSNKYDFIVTNFANGDMVGHTGDFAATVQAVECLDQYIGEVVNTMLSCNGEVLIIADHGNCEAMYDLTQDQPHTQHTLNPVPIIYIGRSGIIAEGGSLADVAPTILALLGLPQPLEMTGKNLITLV
jgi:2,3-bisphosphoglycerate-independent phosphoglycerate mutase